MSAVLSAVADGEVIERGGHDFDAFIKMAAAEEDEAELETAFGFVVDGIVLWRAAGGVFGGGGAGVRIGHRGDVLEREGLGFLHSGVQFILAIRGVEPLQLHQLFNRLAKSG